MSKVTEVFGSMVFNEEVMRQRLSGACYQGWKTCIEAVSYTHLDVYKRQSVP